MLKWTLLNSVWGECTMYSVHRSSEGELCAIAVLNFGVICCEIWRKKIISLKWLLLLHIMTRSHDELFFLLNAEWKGLTVSTLLIMFQPFSEWIVWFQICWKYAEYSIECVQTRVAAKLRQITVFFFWPKHFFGQTKTSLSQSSLWPLYLSFFNRKIHFAGINKTKYTFMPSILQYCENNYGI